MDTVIHILTFIILLGGCFIILPAAYFFGRNELNHLREDRREEKRSQSIYVQHNTAFDPGPLTREALRKFGINGEYGRPKAVPTDVSSEHPDMALATTLLQQVNVDDLPVAEKPNVFTHDHTRPLIKGTDFSEIPYDAARDGL